MTATIEQHIRDLSRRLAIQSQAVGDEQYVRVSERATSAPSVVGVRSPDTDPFTGWIVVATSETPAQARFLVYSVRELLAEHPAWQLGLQLPVGWAFRYVGNTLLDCVSETGETHDVRISVDRA